MAEESAFNEQLEQLMEEEGIPSKEKLLQMLEDADFSDDMKEKLKDIFSGAGGVPEVFGTSGGGNMLGLLFILVIFSIIFFFGYKLYKSIKDKEIKREEKKKAKLMKKKK